MQYAIHVYYTKSIIKLLLYKTVEFHVQTNSFMAYLNRCFFNSVMKIPFLQNQFGNRNQCSLIHDALLIIILFAYLNF